MKLLRWIAALAAAALMSGAAHAETVTVFAAASLKNALDEVGAAYARTGGEARFSYAASSAIARQIEQGAPADVYVSADSDWMNYLAERKLIVAASRRDLLTNRLALIAPADSKATIRVGRGMPLAKALGPGRLAVAGPDVPAGKYAKASLSALGVWDSVSGKLAQAENVRTALQYVARGETPFGVVYDTDAKVEPKVRIVGLFPDRTHPKIVYPAAVVAASKNPDAARFLAYMSSPPAAAIFRKYGFTVLPRR
ncbi:molybdate ABC transporter substrate-binding protein [Phenylobacterium sp.]|uniref:molybdate ABC transporter substrate-binding protein n=1 Tax=Phenylobacterium sp. TaxID=1871053 RepID=UPI0035AE10EE